MAQTRLEKIVQETNSFTRRSITFQVVCIFLVATCVVLLIFQNNKVYSLKNINEMIVTAVIDEYSVIGLVNLNNNEIIRLKGTEKDYDEEDEPLASKLNCKFNEIAPPDALFSQSTSCPSTHI